MRYYAPRNELGPLVSWDSQTYLKDVQYRDTANLDARSRLHKKYGRADWHEWLVAQAGLKPNAVILDVGCGSGAMWRSVAPTLPQNIALHLVDLSEGMVRAASQAVAGEGHFPHISSRVADAQNLPFADHAFDTVFAVHMLYHVPDPLKAVREFHRVLKSNGRVLCVLNDVNHMRDLVELTSCVFGGPSQDRSTLLISVDKAVNAFRERFGAVEVIPFADDLLCTDPKDVFDYVLSLPHSDEELARTAELRTAIDDAFARGNGTFHIRKDVKLIVAFS